MSFEVVKGTRDSTPVDGQHENCQSPNATPASNASVNEQAESTASVSDEPAEATSTSRSSKSEAQGVDGGGDRAEVSVSRRSDDNVTSQVGDASDRLPDDGQEERVGNELARSRDGAVWGHVETDVETDRIKEWMRQQFNVKSKSKAVRQKQRQTAARVQEEEDAKHAAEPGHSSPDEPETRQTCSDSKWQDHGDEGDDGDEERDELSPEIPKRRSSGVYRFAARGNGDSSPDGEYYP